MRKYFHLHELRFHHEYFLFLLPVFFVMHAYNGYFGMVPLGETFLLLLQYEVLIGMSSLLFFFVFLSFRKAALFSFAFGCFYFFFGAVHDWLKEVVPCTVIVKYSFILPSVLLAFASLFFYLKKTNQSFPRLVRYLNILFILLVGVDTIFLLSKESPYKEIVQQATANSQLKSSLKYCDTCKREDVHLIILDEYAGETQLKEELHFDNSAFLNALASRGFYVVADAKSNYNYTELSTASLLCLNYLYDLQGKNDNELYYIGSSIIKQNIFTWFLRNNGYQIHNLSIFDIGERPALNRHFQPGINLVAGNTLWARVEKDLGFHLLYTMPVGLALSNLEQTIRREAAQNRNTMNALLHSLPADPGGQPQFYYTHLLLPHVPYYFDKEGRFTGLQQYLYPGDSTQRNKAYLDYLQYTNKVVLGFVDSILKRSSRPPVILLMGDHGNRHHSLKKESHFSALNAIYFPDRNYEGFYDGLSHVNQLRLLLNHRFGQSLPLLKDTSFYLGK